jgi:hypothetical protein
VENERYILRWEDKTGLLRQKWYGLLDDAMRAYSRKANAGVRCEIFDYVAYRTLVSAGME